MSHTITVQPDTIVVDQSSLATAGPVDLFERLARDPNASVEKIAGLMALWERTQQRNAEVLFNQAMTQAQSEMRHIATDASNPQTRSRYATYAAIDAVLRPIYTRNGFSLSFDTGESQPEWVRVLCYVAHAGGFSRTYHVDMPADGKGAKGGDVMTKTHATGSAMSYGMRYLVKFIFNVAVGEDDDDGNAAGKTTAPPTEPAGYRDFVLDLEATADNGLPALEQVWATVNANPTSQKCAKHLTTTESDRWKRIKAKAAQVTSKQIIDRGRNASV